MGDIYSEFLDELLANIRARPISWEAQQRSGVIDENQVRTVKTIDKQRKDKRIEIVSKAQFPVLIQLINVQDTKKYAQLMCSLVNKGKRADILQFTLVMLNDLLNDVKGFDKEILELDIFNPLLNCLKHEDEAVAILAAQTFTILLASSPQIPAPALKTYFTWLCTLCKNPLTGMQDLAMQYFAGSLRTSRNRLIFWETDPCSVEVVDILKNRKDLQLQYHALLVVWLITFEKKIARELNKKHDIIPALVDISKTAIKEKINRLVIGIFCNLVKNAPEENLPAMVVEKLLNFIKALSGRKWTDQEISEDLSFLQEELQASFDELTTFDEYSSELESGHLSWTPPHRNEEFWRENATKLTEQNNKLLKILARLLTTSKDPIVLAVGCHDVGQLVKQVPKAISQVQQLGVKTRIMELMGHLDPDVRYEALSTVQLLMSGQFL